MILPADNLVPDKPCQDVIIAHLGRRQPFDLVGKAALEVAGGRQQNRPWQIAFNNWQELRTVGIAQELPEIRKLAVQPVYYIGVPAGSVPQHMQRMGRMSSRA